jgi:hypothetical protein
MNKIIQNVKMILNKLKCSCSRLDGDQFHHFLYVFGTLLDMMNNFIDRVERSQWSNEIKNNQWNVRRSSLLKLVILDLIEIWRSETENTRNLMIWQIEKEIKQIIIVISLIETYQTNLRSKMWELIRFKTLHSFKRGWKLLRWWRIIKVTPLILRRIFWRIIQYYLRNMYINRNE